MDDDDLDFMLARQEEVPEEDIDQLMPDEDIDLALGEAGRNWERPPAPDTLPKRDSIGGGRQVVQAPVCVCL